MTPTMNSSLSSKWWLAGVLILALGPGCLPAPEVGEALDLNAPSEPGEATDAGVTFTEVNETILQPNCATSGCHAGNPPPRAPMSLEAGVAYQSLVDKPSTQVPSVLRVVPQSAADSYLI